MAQEHVGMSYEMAKGPFVHVYLLYLLHVLFVVLLIHLAKHVHVQEIGCCSGAKVHTTERYKGLAGRGPRPSDLSDQKWGAPRKGNSGNGELKAELHSICCQLYILGCSAVGSKPH